MGGGGGVQAVICELTYKDPLALGIERMAKNLWNSGDRPN